MEIIVKTIAGLEQVLAKELEDLGAQKIEILNRAARIEGDKKMLYKVNYQTRTAIRVLVPIMTFNYQNEEQFYRRIKSYDWSKHLTYKGTLAIDGFSGSDRMTHSKYLALKAKDAIVDQFRDKYGDRPNVNIIFPTLKLNVHINHLHLCTVSLDSSAESLHKRKYRVVNTEAPISEALAAGMILLSGWDRQSDFIDPMCGSGTIPIEAAMIAYNIPVQKTRKIFGFFKWPDFDQALWEEVKKEAEENRFDFQHKIYASDKDFRAIGAARHNIEEAGLTDIIELRRAKFEKNPAPADKGIVMMNPPYDERLQVREVDRLYSFIGDVLKKHYTGYEAWIISSNIDAMKKIGLHASKKISLFNGPLPCKFQRYELYEGSKKDKSRETPQEDEAEKQPSFEVETRTASEIEVATKPEELPTLTTHPEIAQKIEEKQEPKAKAPIKTEPKIEEKPDPKEQPAPQEEPQSKAKEESKPIKDEEQLRKKWNFTPKSD